MPSELFEPDAPPAAVPTRFAKVVVERGIDRVGDSGDKSLTYSIPEGELEPGQRVIVPLGRGDKPAAGIVTVVGGKELLENLSPKKVKPIARVTPVRLSPLLVKLAGWMGEYYVAPLGMVFATMLPAAVKRQTGRKTLVYLEKVAKEHRSPEAPPPTVGGTGDQKHGHPRADVRGTPALPKRLAKVWEKIEGVDADLWPLTPKALARWAEGVGMGSIKKLLELGYLTQTVREEVVEKRDPFEAVNVEAPGGMGKKRPVLMQEQVEAVERIAGTLGTFQVHLLHGVTGSGKTEVYLKVIEEMLRRGEEEKNGRDARPPGEEKAGRRTESPPPSDNPASSAIMLVPEIALTPQTSQRFVDRFGPKVAVLHSGLTATQRHAQWQACMQGKVRVVVGARSAVFAPLAKVGLIVVDEEHDSSYKQDQLPRYHGRDVAIKRGQLEGCPVVLGSATPSLESWVNTERGTRNAERGTGEGMSDVKTEDGRDARPPGKAQGKYLLSSLPLRVAGAKLPNVRVVDMASERRLRALVQPEGWRDTHLHLLGPTLEQAIGETLLAGGQVMLLLNRRGFANYICCTDPKCGWVMQCAHCDVTTVYHVDRRLKTGGYVRCHHCLAELQLPKACPQCSKAINTFGLGTQRVEAELERKFGPSHGLVMGQTLLRLDGDSMQSARDYFNALSRFGAGDVRVLVGTQMIAKGLDYPNVRLVGIVSADTSLSFPDFRAQERTYQLVAQVSGRAGRGAHPGTVIVQTMNPGEPAIVLAARHDYVRFAELELSHRRANGLPPITRMARIVCRDEVLAEAQKAAEEIAAALRAGAEGLGVKVTGPMACTIGRISGHHRIGIELVASNRTAIQRVLGGVRAQGLLKSDAHTAVDVDPIALL